MIAYLRDGADIYRRSFATIRSEADLSNFDPIVARTAVRMIHACGMVDLTCDIAVSSDFGLAATRALQIGARIFCDATMVASGIIRSRLPAGNEVICTLRDEPVAELAAKFNTTRTAAAVELWRGGLEGALVVIGNAPTALFRVLELIDETSERPAAIIGVPVGFVGAAESKLSLASHQSHIPHLVVHGRRGGSAIAAAAVNGLASKDE